MLPAMRAHPITLPAAGIEDLARDASAEGFRMVRRLLDAWERGDNRFDAPGECLLGVVDQGGVVGVGGLNVDPHTADARTGRVRHLYVRPAWRRRGVGRTLLHDLLARARQPFDGVRLRTTTTAGAAFFESMGFVPVADAEATHALRWADAAPSRHAAVEVPSPIDLRRMDDAVAWDADTAVRRPGRPRFFQAVAEAIRGHGVARPDILELGSGPGRLASTILDGTATGRFVALDFSAAMHAIARARLGANADKVAFVVRDFRDGDWHGDLGTFDVVLSMQAMHEVRHVSRIPRLLAQVRDLTRSGGLFLYCDHYLEPDSRKHPSLHLARDAQAQLLRDAGFTNVACLLDADGMALYRAFRP